MLLQLFISLLLAAALALLLAQAGQRRLFSALLLLAAGWLAWRFYLVCPGPETAEAAFTWLPVRSLHASLNLSTTPEIELLLRPVLILTAALLYLNALYRAETAPLQLNTLVLLSAAAFILLADSRDFIQLTAGSCAFTLLGFYMTDRPGPRCRFAFYTFLAGMALFTALAVVYARLESIDLADLPQFAAHGWHRDLVAVLVIIAVIAPAGLFLFQNQLLQWQELTFNRVLSLSFLGSPLASLLIYAKLSPLVEVCDFAPGLIRTIAALSLLWGAAGALLIDNIKAKALYLNLMFFGFAFAWLQADPAALPRIIALWPAVFMLNFVLLMINLSSSNEIYVSLMGGFARYLKLTFALTLAAAAVWAAALGQTAAWAPKPFFWLYIGLTLPVLSAVFREIYFGSEHADDRVTALLKNVSPALWLPFLAGQIWLGYQTDLPRSAFAGGVILVLLLLMLLGPLRWTGRWYDDDSVQENDPFGRLYQMLLLSPLRLLGRILWLTVDFVVIERSIIGSISETTGMMVRGLQKVQQAVWLNYLLMVLTGGAVIAITIGICYE